VPLGRDLRGLVRNPLDLGEDSVWICRDREDLRYSDGPAVERYLERVLRRSTDLSSSSTELEQWIRDWPTEYHLSRKRSQLLRAFEFSRQSNVLEVGCGCGAITRFLGETFEDVVAVEGSLKRARLARLRTRGMENVALLCAPFQEVEFVAPFDLVFCIGVLEYSGTFINNANPYRTALQRLSESLTPEGVLVLAIENQFGLKYLCSSTEDHSGVMFDGWEGYPRSGNRVRTFGYHELRDLMNEFFPTVDCYFPYPDYKTPSSILAESFFRKARVGELVGSFRSRDYHKRSRPLFDERFAVSELDRNGMLPMFANSFLILAGKSHSRSVRFPYLGVKYSTDRVPSFQTVTHFIETDDGTIRVHKSLANKTSSTTVGHLTLHSTESDWVPQLSLQGDIIRRVKERDLSLEELLRPCRLWLRKLTDLGTTDGECTTVEGRFLDANWSNSYIQHGQCLFVDLEWEWHERIPVHVILIRNIFAMLQEIGPLSGVNPLLRRGTTRAIIERAARAIGVRVTAPDFRAFCHLEAELAHDAFGRSRRWTTIALALTLRGRWILFAGSLVRQAAERLLRRIASIGQRVW